MVYSIPDTNDMLMVTFHNGSHKVHKAYRLVGVTPVSCNTYKENADSSLNIEINAHPYFNDSINIIAEKYKNYIIDSQKEGFNGN